MKKAKIAYFLILILTLSLPLTPAWAQGTFNPNYVLADQDVFDYKSMTYQQIYDFLKAKGSSLTTYKDPITSMLAADIIYRAAQDYRVNPKYLLALLQKEQSLIENGTPTAKKYDWATGYGICDGCSMDDPKLQRFKGFFNQIFAAAKFFRLELDDNLVTLGKTFTGFGPGVAKTVDGVTVTPANNATALLYTYTPHLHGNELLWSIWDRYFSRAYPDGSILNIEGDPKLWLIQDAQRRQFASRAVYFSYYSDPNFDRVITVSESEVNKYPAGYAIKFPVYSFLRSPAGTVYLLLPNETRRGFSSAEALRKIGINPEEIEDVSWEDLTQYAEGEPITIESVQPVGTLIQNSKTGGVYFVENGVKHPIFSKEILVANFGSRKITSKQTTAELEKYITGEPLLFKEGELVKSDSQPAVYVISNKQRRPITSEAAFVKLGYNWDNVIVTNAAAIGVHLLGEPLGEPF